jgi:hypothetical protein
MLYRVILETTSSLQPGSGTYWEREILYCGPDVRQARIAYHTVKPGEFRGYGNAASERVWQVLDESAIDDDEHGEFVDAEAPE